MNRVALLQPLKTLVARFAPGRQRPPGFVAQEGQENEGPDHSSGSVEEPRDDVPPHAVPVVQALAGHLARSRFMFARATGQADGSAVPVSADGMVEDPALLAWLLFLTARGVRGSTHHPCPWEVHLIRQDDHLLPRVVWDAPTHLKGGRFRPRDVVQPLVVDPRWWDGLDRSLTQQQDDAGENHQSPVTVSLEAMVAILSLVVPVVALMRQGLPLVAQVVLSQGRQRRYPMLKAMWYDEVFHALNRDSPRSMDQRLPEMAALLVGDLSGSSPVPPRDVLRDWSAERDLPLNSKHWNAIRLPLVCRPSRLAWLSDQGITLTWFDEKGLIPNAAERFANEVWALALVDRQGHLATSRYAVHMLFQQPGVVRSYVAMIRHVRHMVAAEGVWPALASLAMVFTTVDGRRLDREQQLMACFAWLKGFQTAEVHDAPITLADVMKLIDDYAARDHLFAIPDLLERVDAKKTMVACLKEAIKLHETNAWSIDDAVAALLGPVVPATGNAVDATTFRPCTGTLRSFTNSDLYRPLFQSMPLRPVTVDVWAWQDTMDRAFPWMAEVTARLTRRLGVLKMQGLPLVLPPLALLGPPGSGKTMYWQEALRHLNHPLFVQTMSGTNDSVVIKGTSAGWSTERPGLAATVMAHHRCGNPVVLLDEIDKAGGSSHNGWSSDALLPLLEHRTAATYQDDCLQQTVDASSLSWVLSLNDDEKLPAALRSRVEVLVVDGPSWDNPRHVEAAFAMAERLAMDRWCAGAGSPVTGLTAAQRTALHRTRWNNLRSLGQTVDAMIEENLYDQAVEAALTASPTVAASWRSGQAMAGEASAQDVLPPSDPSSGPNTAPGA